MPHLDVVGDRKRASVAYNVVSLSCLPSLTVFSLHYLPPTEAKRLRTATARCLICYLSIAASPAATSSRIWTSERHICMNADMITAPENEKAVYTSVRLRERIHYLFLISTSSYD